MKNIGWIKLHRAIKDWKYFGNLKYEKVWQTILLEARFDDSEYNGIKLKKGELLFSYRAWADKFRNCNPVITKKNIETIIRNLKNNGQIKTRIVDKKKLTIIEVVNYAAYNETENEHDTGCNDAEKTGTVTQGKLGHLSQETGTVAGTLKETDQLPEMPTNKAVQPELFQTGDVKGDSNGEDKFKKGDSDAARTGTNKRINKKEVIKEVKNVFKDRAFRDVPVPKEKKSQKSQLCGQAGGKEKSKNKFLRANEEKNFIFKVIEILNKKTDKKFKVTTKNTVRLIKARMGEGYTIKDFETLISFKAKEWENKRFKDGTEAKKYLRPSTLFSDQHFDEYLNDALEVTTKKESSEELRARAIEKEKLEQREREEKKEKELQKFMNECDKSQNVIGTGQFKSKFFDDDIIF